MATQSKVRMKVTLFECDTWTKYSQYDSVVNGLVRRRRGTSGDQFYEVVADQ